MTVETAPLAEVGTDFAAKVAPKRERAKPFSARRHAEALAAETPVAVGGGRLWTFEGSGYGDGEDGLRRRIVGRLGDGWRRSHADEILGYLRDASPRLWDEPPLDRVATANGVLDLSNPASPRLAPPDPAFLSTVRIAAAFDPEARCPRIDAFLAEALGPARPLVYELAGYLAVPDNSLQAATMLVGPGATGKSTVIGAIEGFLGRANVSHVSLHRLESDRFASADLYGRLANTVADLDPRELRHSSVFKSITGGDVIRGERKHRDPFDFKPFCRLLFSANEVPAVADSSDAFFRRWLVVPCEQRVPAANRDPRLLERLTAPQELSGLLNRALDGLAALRERGHFPETEGTREAAARFRCRADTVSGFFEERCVADPDSSEVRPELYAAYRTWCQETGRNPIPNTRFYDRLEQPPFELRTKKVRGIVHLGGARLADDKGAGA